MKVLIVDDSVVVRTVLSRMMAEHGFESLTAGNGREALDLIGSGTIPDLLLVDWNMPVVNGLDFVRNVRRPPYSISAKIIMVTTETDVANVITALSEGVDEYLMKPFTADAMAEKLQILGFDE